MSDDVDDIVALLIIQQCLKMKRKCRKKRTWVKDLSKDIVKRPHLGLLKPIEITAPDHFKNLIGMSSDTYEELLALVIPRIKKQDTLMRQAITPNARLSATLLFLATGQCYEDIKLQTNIGKSTLAKLVLETCQEINLVLKDYIQQPRNEDEWKSVAKDFEKKWNFNNCIGAIGGKHINIKKPPNFATQYYNYKKTFSFVLMAVVNANYEIMRVEIGKGATTENGIFAESNFKNLYDNGLLNLPFPQTAPNTDEYFPFVFVANEAFPLLENLMVPYTGSNLNNFQQIFNCRLLEASQVAENTLNVLVDRFKVLQTIISLYPEKAALIAKTCCYLHNFLEKKNSLKDMGNSFEIAVDRIPESLLHDLEPISSENITNAAEIVRSKYCNFFNTVGAVPWQNTFV